MPITWPIPGWRRGVQRARRPVLPLAALAVAAFFTSGGPALAISDRDAFVSDGAVLLAQPEVADLFSGNTFHGTVWTSYFGPEGRKVTTIGGRIIEREWWVDDDGQVCQTLNRTSETVCAPEFYVLDGVYRSFNDDGSLRVEFTMEPGNPNGL